MPIKFANYVVERLKQCGVKYVMGVPGDYTLQLDYFEDDPDIEWVGNANELNAAYAADGYARVKNNLAVIVTTFGVGELSALCGIAGSLAERLPVLHIVGAPSTKLQRNQSLLHHTLNLPNSFTAFHTMSEQISCSMALINDIEPVTDHAWTDAFDRVLTDVLEQCRPGYVELPTDSIEVMVSDEGLKTKPPHPHSAPPPENLASSLPPDATVDTNTVTASLTSNPTAPPSNEVTDFVVDQITEKYRQSKKPIVIVDACCGRFGMGPTVRKLVESCQIRFFETPMGKSLVDEHSPLYGGCYAGANSLKEVKEEVESADLVIYVGALKSDFNSGSFSVNIDPKVIIELHSFTTTIGFANFPTTDIRTIVPRLVPKFQEVFKVEGPKTHGQSIAEKIAAGAVEKPVVDFPNEKVIKQAWFWPRMGEWFQNTDIIITETGTASFGLTNVLLPSESMYLAQILWGAIGWSVGACLGAALAATELKTKRRTVLFVGDGSLQLTLQEIGTMVRRGLHPYIFVLNNDGYEIERQIHGAHAQYNNIQMYDHQKMLPFLAGKSPDPHESYAVHTPKELTDLLEDPEFNKPDKIRMIEIFMLRGDAPAGLISQAKLTAEANAE